jgi:3-hydroxyisobutyrate dehydrogenase
MHIAVIGLGSIGAGVSRLALTGGHEVTGYDVRDFAEGELPAGLNLAKSPAEAVEGADFALVAVFDDAQLDSVLSGPGGITSASHPAPVLAILSTVSTESVRHAHTVGASIGVEVLDCGVSGGSSLSRGERLALAIGGDPAACEQVRAGFESFGDPAVYMGPLGSGMAAKLARNLIHYSSAWADSEGARLATGAGVELASFVEFVKGAERKVTGRMGNVAADPATGQVATSPGLARYATKDLGAALELAEELNISLPNAELVRSNFQALS